MTDAERSRRFHFPPWPIVLLALVFVFGAAMTLWGPVNLMAWRGGDVPPSNSDRPVHEQKILEVIRVQHEDQPGGRRYFTRGDAEHDPSEGAIAPKNGTDDPLDDAGRDADGPWDAAFVSWVLNEAGIPVRPEAPGKTDAWLVTGTPELADAMAARGAYVSAEDDPEFRPQVGDLIFYDYPGPFGYHVNIVIGGNGDNILTAGGDELGRVGIASMDLRNRGGIMGWGTTGRLADQIAANPEFPEFPEGAEDPEDAEFSESAEAPATPEDAPR
ncbi:CHAP domain-containing protein [uncultured Corynebacterium sp.]|uniref:CHAP domain-containing protein n=1 Tax=uncultured Corynebacterium sp. TaxID=159447 RepID=UPI0025CC76FC|nr:CHAP domain-containing protein [uncultured Corynebacterium sp.]